MIGECPEDIVLAVAQLVGEEMTRVASLSVPLEAEANVGKSWYEAK